MAIPRPPWGLWHDSTPTLDHRVHRNSEDPRTLFYARVCGSEAESAWAGESAFSPCDAIAFRVTQGKLVGRVAVSSRAAEAKSRGRFSVMGAFVGCHVKPSLTLITSLRSPRFPMGAKSFSFWIQSWQSPWRNLVASLRLTKAPARVSTRECHAALHWAADLKITLR